MPILFIFAFLAGICTMLSPCILPVLPIVLAAGASKGKWKPLGVCLGLIVSFTFFTITLTSIVHAFGISANTLRYMGIFLVFLFGLSMVIPSLSRRVETLLSPVAKIGENIQEKGSKNGFGGGFILGIALGLIWTPCAGPILAAITAYIATQAITLPIVFLALTFVIGASIPLFFLAWGGGQIVRASQFFKAHAEGVRAFFGWVTIVVALAIAFHWDVAVEQKVGRYVPSLLIEDNQLVQKQLGVLQNEIKQDANAEVPSGGTPMGYTPYGRAPELIGLTNWINSPPLSLQQLRGQPVLIDFWTYTCINCLRTLPSIENLYNKYKDRGLVVIGIHTPEFEFEKDPINVIEAVHRLGITYPVAQDNNYTVWQAYHNHFWPAHYLIDQSGNIVDVHFGEGGYAELENDIRSLVHLPQLTDLEPSANFQPTTPETYLGTVRGRSFTAENHIIPNQTVLYTRMKPLQNDEVGLKGKWLAQPERITAEGNDCYLDCSFLAKQVYVVLTGSSPLPLQISLDGNPPQELFLDGDRDYTVANTTYGRHLLSIKVPLGISAYAFTFGAE